MTKKRSNGLTGKPSNNKGNIKNGPHKNRCVRLPESLLAALESQAEAQGKTTNLLMVEALSACVSDYAQEISK